MKTIKETELKVGDVYRPTRSGAGFMNMIVVAKEDNGELTVHRPFCYGIEQEYKSSVEVFAFFPNANFEVDVIERR